MASVTKSLSVPLTMFASDPLQGRPKRRRTGESAFVEGYINMRNLHFQPHIESQPTLAKKMPSVCVDDNSQILGAAESQKRYFKHIDEAKVESPSRLREIFKAGDDRISTKEWELKLERVRQDMRKHIYCHEIINMLFFDKRDKKNDYC